MSTENLIFENCLNFCIKNFWLYVKRSIVMYHIIIVGSICNLIVGIAMKFVLGQRFEGSEV